VDQATFERVSLAAGDPAMPRWLEGDGRVKLSAAWLIEEAGLRRGAGPGPVALSTRHSLAIVCREGARAADVVAFAGEIRARVEARFGVRLVPEPVFWGGLSLAT
jgi:UDP-N-acetylmuramate dehydrogenase